MSDEIAELEKKIAELRAKQATAAPANVTNGIKIDIGCGPNKKEGFIGVDVHKFDGVDIVLNAGLHKWPWEDGTVDEVHCSHMIEHLTWEERVHFFNELGRVLKKDGVATVILPHWASNRYYGDPTHKAPFSEMGWFYLKKEWRKGNAPHCDSEIAPGPLSYSCDFDVSYGYSLAPWMVGRSTEFQQFAFAAYKEAAQDMIGTLKKAPTQ